MAVFVIDCNDKPLNDCSEKRARLLLERKRALVVQTNPFKIKLLDRTREECGHHLADVEIINVS